MKPDKPLSRSRSIAAGVLVALPVLWSLWGLLRAQ